MKKGQYNNGNKIHKKENKDAMTIIHKERYVLKSVFLSRNETRNRRLTVC
jgi:hypothetical protein